MRNKRKIKAFIYLSFSMLMLLVACNLPGVAKEGSQSAELLYTQAAQTIVAQLTSQVAPLQTGVSTPVPADTLAAPVPSVGATMPIPTQPTSTPTPTATPQPSATLTPSPTPVLIFQDDFSKDRNWFLEKNKDFGFEYADGGYRVYVNMLNAPVWSVRGKDLADVRLEVDATHTGGVSDGYFGLVCRHQDENNYYSLVISSDGSYGFMKMKDGKHDFVKEGEDQANVIQRGGGTNHIRADCIGNTLTLYANGQKLLEVQDDDFASGDVGLLAGTRLTKGGVEVLFDNFAIYQP
jgi:hypothetical protein